MIKGAARILLLWFVLLGAPLQLSTSLASIAVAAPRSEAEVKSEIVYNVLVFVQWPAAESGTGQPLQLCLLNAGPMEASLIQLAGRPVHGQQLSVITITGSNEEIKSCNAIWIDSNNADALLRMASAARQRPLLIISEGSTSIGKGAMVALYPEGGRIALAVNNAASRSSRLMVSSKLLRMARIVTGGGND